MSSKIYTLVHSNLSTILCIIFCFKELAIKAIALYQCSFKLIQSVIPSTIKIFDLSKSDSLYK